MIKDTEYMEVYVKLIHFFMFSLFLFATTTKPMHRALKFGLAFLPTVTVSVAKAGAGLYCNYWLKKDPKKLSPEEFSPDFKKFVHKECKAVGIKDAEDIHILPGCDDGASSMGSNLIYIGRYAKKFRYDDALSIIASGSGDQAGALKDLNKLRCTCQHEANHVKNKDHQRYILAGVAVPSATYVLATRLDKSFINRHCTTLQKYVRAGIKGTMLGAVNFGLLTLYMRHREQQADNGVQDTKEILQAGIDDSQTNPDEFDLFHPSPRTRVKKFEKRLAKLN